MSALKCLTCGHEIAEDSERIDVQVSRGSMRHAHATAEGCAAAMADGPRRRRRGTDPVHYVELGRSF